MDQLSKIPQPVIAFLAIVGLAVTASKIISYIRLLLSLFVLSGKNVSRPVPNC